MDDVRPVATAGQVYGTIDRIIVRPGPRGCVADVFLGDGATMATIGADNLNTYTATRKALLKGAGILLQISDIEYHRRAHDQRAEWQAILQNALEAGGAG